MSFVVCQTLIFKKYGVNEIFTICMKCHERKANATSSLKSVSRKSKEGIAYKRYDGKWWVCINEKEPFMVDQSDLMDSKKFFVTQVGSTLNAEETKKKSAKLKRYRKKLEANNHRSAKIIAENKREEWIKTTYHSIMHSARQGNPWSFQKYRQHLRQVESPFLVTVGDYRVATGGVDQSACFKTLAGEIISGAIAGQPKNGKKTLTEEELLITQSNKRKKMNNSRTENTIHGSDGISADRRLTKRTKKDEIVEKNNRVNALMKNIEN